MSVYGCGVKPVTRTTTTTPTLALFPCNYVNSSSNHYWHGNERTKANADYVFHYI